MNLFLRALLLVIGIVFLIVGVNALINGFYTANPRSGGTFVVDGKRAIVNGWLMVTFGVAIGASALFKFSEQTAVLTMVGICAVAIALHSCVPG